MNTKYAAVDCSDSVAELDKNITNASTTLLILEQMVKPGGSDSELKKGFDMLLSEPWHGLISRRYQ